MPMSISELLAALLLCTIAAMPLSATTQAKDDIDLFFKAFKEKRDGIESLEAKFTQTTKLPEEELITEGILQYSRPRRILFLTEEPEHALLMDGRQGYEYDADIRQMTMFFVEDHPRANIFFLGFDNDTEALRAAYDLTLLITDDPRGRQGIKITPRPDSEESDYFLEVNLYLRESDFFPYRIHIVNDLESELFIDVKEIRTLNAQDHETPRIFLPEGVTIVAEERVVDLVGEGGRYVPVGNTGTEQTVHELPPLDDEDADEDEDSVSPLLPVESHS
ncbi:MAG: outer membrane lipoprotein carrier protein LolA [Candidatus Hydrogenedens sp.]|nr:outer membrane lipoprotein carrier protein LolA [Candidatus Hydrogenedens sp.]